LILFYHDIITENKGSEMRWGRRGKEEKSLYLQDDGARLYQQVELGNTVLSGRSGSDSNA
jgi:hypothetical protein